MTNRKPEGFLDNDCEANIDENMNKLITKIGAGGGTGSNPWELVYSETLDTSYNSLSIPTGDFNEMLVLMTVPVNDTALARTYVKLNGTVSLFLGNISNGYSEVSCRLHAYRLPNNKFTSEACVSNQSNPNVSPITTYLTGSELNVVDTVSISPATKLFAGIKIDIYTR